MRVARAHGVTASAATRAGDGLLRLVTSGDESGHGGVEVGALATAAVMAPADADVSAVDEIFRRQPALRCVVLDITGAPRLIDRTWYESLMTGPMGYGRLLFSRRLLRDVVPIRSVVLDARTTVASAAAVIIEHGSAGTVHEAVLVAWTDGTLGVVTAAAVFEQLARHFAHQSMHDPMTGLPNRSLLMHRLYRADRDTEPTVLLYVDLDRFKDVNDHLGHAAGDEVLVQFAQRLLGVVGEEDVVARLGGDEFAVLRTGNHTRTTITALAERLVLEAAAPFVVGSGEDQQLVHLGASVGVARSDVEGSEQHRWPWDVILRHADLAIYRAKAQGRGRSAHFEPSLLVDLEKSGTRARRDVERRLRHAISADRIAVHFQPVVDLATGQPVGHEALARWDDPELGPVSPGEFIPVAETAGLVTDLGRRVLDQACRHAARWTDRTAAGLLSVVSVNVSPVQLADRGFVADVETALRESGLAPGRLCLEITETAAIDDVASAARRLGRLRDLGVRLALDDFGTGHSSLTLLRELPVHVLKIDRSFIARITTDRGDAVLVALLVDAAHRLGLDVCAEGVETRAQADALVEMGCDLAQGWLYGRPAPPV
ncbi:MAG: bifunctional diguanylate cyclase/phosphodiesterase [Nocardioidaceae bacterium]|nr:bifunctional diguanylate cyclase/phosphodiesterase [Nocardioidaceae bacterium]